MNNKATIWILLAVSAALLSVPYLVPHCGFFILFAIVPLLCADKIATDTGMRRFWLCHYACFCVWNFITTFWVCNATVGGGIFASLANALQMSVVFGLYRLSRKKFSGVLPYLFLMFAWIAWERWYLGPAQISWPWLVLGNAFARSIGSVQWYEYTGALGGSLWAWASNLAIFGMMTALGDGRFFTRWNSLARTASVTGLAALITVPFMLSAVIWHSYEEQERPLDVLICQPNFDPYQKFQSMTQAQQNAVLTEMIDEALAGECGCEDDCCDGCDDSGDSGNGAAPLVILAPETFTGDIFTGDIPSSRTWQTFLAMLQRHRNASLMFGASSWEYMHSHFAPSLTARKAGMPDTWYESHNSALMMNCTGETSIFHKSKLVVGVEMMPYPKFFSKIDRRLGGVMGRCVGQDEVSLLSYHSEDGSISIPLGCAICYESVYGEYCTEYVRKGAQALAIITNDAWWGDTPGYRQHCSYASLRAIETRRSIARCANTGISCFIDQRGRILEKSKWWERETLRGNVNLNDSYTFFVVHGDITGRICTMLFLLLALSLGVRIITRR